MSRKIGALWLKTANDGRKFFSGVLQDLTGDINIAVFKNDRKEKENQPDYNIVLSEQAKPSTKRSEDYGVNEVPPPSDDIPF